MAKNGKLIAYVGPMGAGKTKKLVEIFTYFLNEKVEVSAFQPLRDTRGSRYMVTARDGSSAPAYPVRSINEVVREVEKHNIKVVLIDEIQFFEDKHLALMLEALTMAGVTVYVFGLDVTSENRTFGQIGEVLAHADEVYKLKAKCHRCGEDARISRYVRGEKTADVLIGTIGDYQPICRCCLPNFLPDEGGKRVQLRATTSQGEYEFDFSVAELEAAGYKLDDIKKMSNDEIVQMIEDLGFDF